MLTEGKDSSRIKDRCWGWGDGFIGKVLTTQIWGLEFEPLHLPQKLGTMVLPVIQVLGVEMQGQRSPGSLGSQPGQVGETSHLKSEIDEEDSSLVQLWPPRDAHAHTYMHKTASAWTRVSYRQHRGERASTYLTYFCSHTWHTFDLMLQHGCILVSY